MLVTARHSLCATGASKKFLEGASKSIPVITMTIVSTNNANNSNNANSLLVTVDLLNSVEGQRSRLFKNKLDSFRPKLVKWLKSANEVQVKEIAGQLVFGEKEAQSFIRAADCKHRAKSLLL